MRLLLLAAFAFLGITANAHACTNPTGVKAEIIYNTTHNVPIYCDGTNWIAMTGGNLNNNTCPNGLASCGGRSDQRVVFVGGPTRGDEANATANATCNSQAAAAGLNGTYRAWYSQGGSSSDPESTFERSTVPYVRPDGVQVADNWTDLTDGSLDANISRFADGTTVSSLQSTWTFTDTTGAWISSTCTAVGVRGLLSSSTSSWTTNGTAGPACNTGGRGYCFEQPSKLTEIVPSGLIGHWRLDETSGSLMFDSGPNSFNGGYGGGLNPASRSIIGQVARGMNVNGIPNATLQVSSNAAFTSLRSMTATMWVNFESYSGISGLLDISGLFRFRTQFNTGRIMFSTTGWSGTDGSWKFNPTGLNRWRHIAVVYSYDDPIGTRARLYVDGVDITSGVGTAFSPAGSFVVAGSSTVRIGFREDSTGGAIKGALDDVRLYNRKLTADEIVEIYQARDGIRYNANQRKMEYFDGNRHVSMTPAWPDVTDGLVGHWKLDETTGTTAADSSGNGKDGAMTGGLNATSNGGSGAVGRSLKFDGIDDYIIEPNSFGLTGSASVSAWFRKDANGLSSDPQIFNFYLDNDTEWALVVDNSNQIEILDDTGGAEQFIYTTPIVQGRWYHAVAMMDGLENKLYLDGVLIGSGISAGMSIDGIGGDLFIGSKRSNWQFFNGAIDDMRIYNRALGLSEIQSLYQIGAPVGSVTALPQGCPNIGDICDDGTIYAGIYNTNPYYTTPASAGDLPANNGNSSGKVLTTATNDINGITNSNILITTDSDSITAGFQPHQAVQYCNNLSAHGADDWYLPARIESRNTLCFNKDVIPDVQSYWTSRQTDTSRFETVRVSDCTYSGQPSETIRPVRCVRKGPAPRCANPYGIEGQLTYNVTHEVVQYCDGARWIAIGKSGP